MTRLFIFAPLVLAACAGAPADWGFTDNDPRRALVPTEYPDKPAVRRIVGPSNDSWGYGWDRDCADGSIAPVGERCD